MLHKLPFNNIAVSAEDKFTLFGISVAASVKVPQSRRLIQLDYLSDHELNFKQLHFLQSSEALQQSNMQRTEGRLKSAKMKLHVLLSLTRSQTRELQSHPHSKDLMSMWTRTSCDASFNNELQLRGWFASSQKEERGGERPRNTAGEHMQIFKG